MEFYCPKCGYPNSNRSDRACCSCGYIWEEPKDTKSDIQRQKKINKKIKKLQKRYKKTK